MTSLSCKKFKIIFTLKRGHEGQLICIQKNIKLAAIYEKGQYELFFNGNLREVRLIDLILILLNLKDSIRTIGVLRIYTKQHADHESLQYFFL